MRSFRLFRSALVAPALLALALLAAPTSAPAQPVVVSITVAPPVLPIYVQPPLPAPGYIWTPGYWAWGPSGYFWVPGTWVLPPTVGLLWTPGYWGWVNSVYIWHRGYWGPHVGFYGGINYGFGYTGVGYAGGYWNRGVFAYNRSVNNFGRVHVTNVYNRTVINNRTVTRMSFNGGNGGTRARPTAQEQAAARDQHHGATTLQTQHEHLASTNRALRNSVNHGHPAIAATTRPTAFTGPGTTRAQGAAARPASNRPQARPAARPAERPTQARPAARPAPHSQAQPRPATRPAPHPQARPAHSRPAGHPAPHRQARPAQTRPAPHPAARPAPHPQARPAPADRGGAPGDRGGDRQDRH